MDPQRTGRDASSAPGGTRPARGALRALITIHLAERSAFLGFDGRSVQVGRQAGKQATAAAAAAPRRSSSASARLQLRSVSCQRRTNGRR